MKTLLRLDGGFKSLVRNVLVALLGGLILSNGVPGRLTAAPLVESNPHVQPDAITAFKSLTHHGEPLGFRMIAGVPQARWDGDLSNGDGENGRETHYQGIARSRGPGVPYFYVTRSGMAPNDSGNLFVIRMGSRPTDGERLRSNRLQRDAKINETLPPTEDVVVKNIFFEYRHAGSVTRVGDILAVALEKPKTTDLPKARVVFLDVSDPQNPVRMAYSLDTEEHDIGVVGMAKLSDGHFLCVLCWGKNEKMEFYRSTRTSFSDPDFEFVLHDTWESSELADWPAGSGACYQDLSLITQSNGRVYMIGSRRTHEYAPFSGDDKMALYEVRGWEANTPSTNVTLILKVEETQKWTDTPGLILNAVRNATQTINADFLAGAGAYVSPSGQLYFYATEHWNDGPGFCVRGVEFRPRDVAPEGSALYGNRSNLRVTSFVLGEGDTLNLDASAATRGVKPWVELYADDNYEGRSVIMDFDDRFLEDYQDFRKFGDGFNDDASSVRWYAPAGWSFVLHAQDNFGTSESTKTLVGSGKPSEQSLVSDFNNRVTSMKFVPPANHNLGQGATVAWSSPGGDPAVAALGATATKIAQLFGGSKAGTFPVKITIGPDPVKTETYTFTVTNKPPRFTEFSVSRNGEVGEAGQSVLKVGLRDDGVNDVVTATVDWGDGGPATQTTLSAGARELLVSHGYADVDPCQPESTTYRIRVTLTDNEGGAAVQTREHTVYWNRPLVSVRGWGSSLVLDGSGFAKVPHDARLRVFPLTVTAWVKTEQTNSTGLVSKYAPNFGGYQIHLVQGRVHAWHFNGVLGWVAGENDRYAPNGVDFIGNGLDGGFVADGLWHHVAWLVDENGGSLYVDGVLKASRPWTGTPGPSINADGLYLGAWPGARGPADRTRFVGELDEVGIWNRILSPQELDIVRYVPISSFEPGLAAVFKMDERGGLKVLGYQNGAVTYQGELTTGISWNRSGVGRWPRDNQENQGLHFPGTGQVEVDSVPAFNAFPMTLAFWMRTEQTNYAAVFHKMSEGGSSGFQVNLDAGRLSALYLVDKQVGVGLQRGGWESGFVADGQWHHVVVVVDETGGLLYVDGEALGLSRWSGPPGPIKGNTSLLMGRKLRGLNSPLLSYRGDLDDISFWNVSKNSQAARQLALGALQGDEPGLVAYWPLEVPAVDVFDYRLPDLAPQSGNNVAKVDRDLTWVDSNVWAARSQKGAGSALRFNGVDGSVAQVGGDPINPFPLTAMAWIKTTQTNQAALINSYFAGSLDGWQMFLADGHLRAWYFGDPTRNVYGGGNGLDGGWVADCEWHHVAFVVDEQGGRLYVDGELRAERAWSGAPLPPKSRELLKLGLYPGDRLATGTPYRGLMDEVSIWDVALDAATIRSVARGQAAWDADGLVGYWRCNEGEGEVLHTYNVPRLPLRMRLNSGVSWEDSTAPVGPPVLAPILGTPSVGPDSKVTIPFAGQPGFQYRVFRSQNLGGAEGGWVEVGVAEEALPGHFRIRESNPVPAGPVQTFYKLVVP